MYDDYIARIGRKEVIFAQCAASGFLIPWIPALLGFRVFGKGIGGVFRTTAVGSLSSIFCASVFPQSEDDNGSGMSKLPLCEETPPGSKAQQRQKYWISMRKKLVESVTKSYIMPEFNYTKFETKISMEKFAF